MQSVPQQMGIQFMGQSDPSAKYQWTDSGEEGASACPVPAEAPQQETQLPTEACKTPLEEE